jgi:large subunit ribosomal protein L5
MANLRERYNTELKAVLQEKLGMNNVMAVPKLTKVVINMGVGEAANDKKTFRICCSKYDSNSWAKACCY